MAWWRKPAENSTVDAGDSYEAPIQHAPPPAGDEAAVLAVMEDTRPVPAAEIAELEAEVVPGRRAELEAIITLGHATSYLRSDVVCLAAVIDVAGTQLARWKRFQNELGAEQSYMWGDALYDDPPADSIVPPGLSHTARLVLAAQEPSTGTYRRTSDELAQKYLLTAEQITQVRDELCAAGFATWGPPTVQEAIGRLTVADLQPILETLDVKASWTKAKKLETMFATLAHDELTAFLLARNPDALCDTLNILFPVHMDWSFHQAWATVAAHFIDFSGYRDREWNEVRDLRATGAWPNLTVDVLPAGDDCGRCEVAARRIDFDDKTTWPPFHLGCRCSVMIELD
jgi:hypothetical protein